MFIRFVEGSESENAARLTGLFMTAGNLDDEGGLDRHESEHLHAVFDWFQENLPCPPFRRNLDSGKWTSAAVCWFRPEAQAVISRMWDLVAILREHGVCVRLVRSRKPGKIIYEDKYQIVAETPYWA
jgi:hypothetical protein